MASNCSLLSMFMRYSNLAVLGENWDVFWDFGLAFISRKWLTMGRLWMRMRLCQRRRWWLIVDLRWVSTFWALYFEMRKDMPTSKLDDGEMNLTNYSCCDHIAAFSYLDLRWHANIRQIIHHQEVDSRWCTSGNINSKPIKKFHISRQFSSKSSLSQHTLSSIIWYQ